MPTTGAEETWFTEAAEALAEGAKPQPSTEQTTPDEPTDLRPRAGDTAAAGGSPAKGMTRPRSAGALWRMRRAQRGTPLEASFAQQRLWYLEQLAPHSARYLSPVVLQIDGPLDAEALREALDELVRRHEALRTAIRAVKGAPMQFVEPVTRIPFTTVDYGHLPLDQAQRRVADDVLVEASTGFDLSSAPLTRAWLGRVTDDRHVLCWTVHHVATDGWSFSVLARELGTLYEAYSSGHPAGLAAPSWQYADYAVSQREYLSGPLWERQEAFWRDALAELEPMVLPQGRPEPSSALTSDVGAAGRVVRQVPLETADLVRILARSEHASVFMVLLAAFEVLLGRYAGSDDVTVATPVANRHHPGLEGIVGFFANTLVIRGDLTGRPGFRELLGRVRGRALDAFAHQDLPFEVVTRIAAPARSEDGNALTSAMFSLHTADAEAWHLPGLRVQRITGANRAARFDLSLLAREASDGSLALTLTHAGDTYDRETAERLLKHYVTLLGHAVRVPDTPVHALALLTAAERAQLAAGQPAGYPSDTDAPPATATVHALIEAQAARTPDLPALLCGMTTLTYRELNVRADRLARRIVRHHRLGPDCVVGVHLKRGPDLLVALLAVLKSGVAYTPLEPSQPTARLRHILLDSRASLLITSSTLTPLAPDVAALFIDDAVPGDTGCSGTSTEQLPRPSAAADPDRLAYVIYTSGSTGTPKGVAVTHRSAVNHLAWACREYCLGPGDTVVGLTSLMFDASVRALFAPLCAGATVLLPTDDWYLNPAALTRQILDGTVTVVGGSTPSIWRYLLPELTDRPHDHMRLRLTMVGGESFRLMPTEGLELLGEIYNEYGPTECTITALFHPMSAQEVVRTARGLEPDDVIGTPTANVRAYVLDRFGEPVPPGVLGELYLAGPGVARGYLNQPELTARSFVPCPFGPPGDRMYRTGDLARLRSDGKLVFAGRNDDQVKIRGFRIEPGEIAAALRRDPEVTDAVVVPYETGIGETCLAAYVVTPSPGQLDQGPLRDRIRQWLPDYMVPAVILQIPTIPVTSQGKVDRRALPAPQSAPRTAADWQTAPTTPDEQTIAAIWRGALGVDVLGLDDDFFSLGGHSLLATRVIARLQERFGVDFPLRAFLRAPTIRGAVSELDRARQAVGSSASGPAYSNAVGGNDPASAGTSTSHPSDADPGVLRLKRADRSVPLELSFAQQRLWFLDQLSPMSPEYVVPLVLDLRGPLDPDALQASLDALVQRHEALRTAFRAIAGRPVQQVESADLTLNRRDFTALPSDQAEAAALAEIRTRVVTGFDLGSSPLTRAWLGRVSADRHLLCWTVHHVATDGWSSTILARELATIYTAHKSGRPPELAPASWQYADYAISQREYLTGPRWEHETQFWREALAGLVPLRLPTDYARPGADVRTAGRVASILPAHLAEKVRMLARGERASMFMVLMAAFAVVLGRYAEVDDVSVATPVANRHHPGLEDIVGLFTNTLVIRTGLEGDPDFRRLVGQVRDHALDAYAHQDLPFEVVTRNAAPSRSADGDAVTSVMFDLQTPETQTWHLPGVQAQRMSGFSTTTHFDLTLTAQPGETGITFTLTYATALFKHETAKRLIDYYTALLTSAITKPDAPTSTLMPGPVVRPPHLPPSAPSPSDGTSTGGDRNQIADTGRSATETVLRELMEALLGLPVAADESFIARGGHSLMTVRLASMIATRLGTVLNPRDIFEHPTPASLAIRIDDARSTPAAEHDPQQSAELDHDARAPLDLTLNPAIAGPASGVPDPQNVLLTGATGYFGAFLLRNLLDRTRARVWCLVRAQNSEQAAARLRENLVRYGLTPTDIHERVRIVRGDLCAPRLGLPTSRYTELARTLDVIYHGAAHVNHLEPYRLLRPANVDGTREILRLAAAADRTVPVHYVSTLGAALGRSEWSGTVPEDQRASPAALVGNGYTASKWVGEALVLRAGAAGLHTTVHRPSRIIGSAANGACADSDTLWNYVKAVITLGATPSWPPSDPPGTTTDASDDPAGSSPLLDLVPADYAAAAVVEISLRPAPSGRILPLVAEPTTLEGLHERLRARGYQLAALPHQQWRETLAAAYAPAPAHRDTTADALIRTAMLGASGPGRRRSSLRYSQDTTLHALAGTGLGRPMVDYAVTDSCINYLIATGFLPPPA